jgi:aminopeptidase N
VVQALTGLKERLANRPRQRVEVAAWVKKAK